LPVEKSGTSAAFFVTNSTANAVQAVGFCLQPEDVAVRRGAADISAVRGVNEAAFERKEEADLVDRLRNEGAVLAMGGCYPVVCTVRRRQGRRSSLVPMTSGGRHRD
jgi:hypothetical protein